LSITKVAIVFNKKIEGKNASNKNIKINNSLDIAA
jgi:hypothetical protein